MTRRARRWVLVVLTVAVTLAIVLAVRSFLRQGSPETPANAVLDFDNHVVLGEYDAAWDRMCSSTKASALGNGDAFVSVRSFMAHAGSISTNDETQIDGDTAVERVTVRPRGVSDDRTNEQWDVHLSREGGKWRVCTVEQTH